jgi:hypothetical protein
MLETYQRGETPIVGIEVKDAAGTLYTPDTSITCSIWDPTGTAVVVAAAMTAGSTGNYTYDFATTAASALGCYRVECTTVNAGRTSKQVDYIVVEDRAVGAVGWCVATLADQNRSEMDVNPDAAGGRIPDRVMKIIREKGRWLFKREDWLFRRAPGTLTIAAGLTEVSMPTDFAELDGRLMQCKATTGYRLYWTQNYSMWQAAKDRIGHDAPAGSPRIALLYYTGGAWKARFWPESDVEYTYDYWYLKADPWSGATPIADNIQLSPTYWPADFDILWEKFCRYELVSRYRTDEAWRGFRKEGDDALKALIAENDETIGDNIEPIQDALGYFRSTARAQMGVIPENELSFWFAST